MIWRARTGPRIGHRDLAGHPSPPIEKVLSQVERRLEDTLRLRTGIIDLEGLASRVSRLEGVEWALVLSGSRMRRMAQIRRLFCQLAVKKFGYSGAQVARCLGTTTSSVTRPANSPELPDCRRPEYGSFFP